MKKILLSVFLFSSFFLQAQSYQRKSPEEKARKYTDELKAVVPVDSLTEEKIFHINVRVSRQIDSLYAGKPDKDELRKAYAYIFSARDSAFRQVLSATAFLRYDDWQRELREKRWKEKMEKEKQQTPAESPVK